MAEPGFEQRFRMTSSWPFVARHMEQLSSGCQWDRGIVSAPVSCCHNSKDNTSFRVNILTEGASRSGICSHAQVPTQGGTETCMPGWQAEVKACIPSAPCWPPSRTGSWMLERAKLSARTFVQPGWGGGGGMDQMNIVGQSQAWFLPVSSKSHPKG